MAKPWTKERLEELERKQLNALYENARRAGSDEADEILEPIAQHKLLDRLGGGYPRHHPIIQKIEEVTRSPAGIAAAIAAAEAGNAPMAGVDLLLQNALGSEYGHRDTTGWAGGFVKDEMVAEGWEHHGRKALPQDCVAKTAAFFIKEPK